MVSVPGSSFLTSSNLVPPQRLQCASKRHDILHNVVVVLSLGGDCSSLSATAVQTCRRRLVSAIFCPWYHHSRGHRSQAAGLGSYPLALLLAGGLCLSLSDLCQGWRFLFLCDVHFLAGVPSSLGACFQTSGWLGEPPHLRLALPFAIVKAILVIFLPIIKKSSFIDFV